MNRDLDMHRCATALLLICLCIPALSAALDVTITWSSPRLYGYPPPADLSAEGSVQATFHGDEAMNPVDGPWLTRITSEIWRGTWLWNDEEPREAVFASLDGDTVTVTAVRQPARPLDLAGHDVLIVTVDTQREHLWSPETGIYVWGLFENCLQTGSDWERPATINGYTPTGSLQWSEACGLRINGQSTRYHVRKGLRCYFDDYGFLDWLQTDLFGDGTARFGRTILKTSLLPGHVVSSTIFEPLHRELGHLGSRHRLAALYLDGEYWGAYNVRERIDDHFVEVTHELADNNEYTLIKDNEAVEGDRQDWDDFLAGYAVPPQPYGSHSWFTAVEARLDLEAYMDWIYLNIHGAAADNGYVNNVAVLKVDGGRWRFIAWDEEGLMAEDNLASNHFRFYAAADAAEFEQFRPPVWSMGDWWAPHQPWRDLFRGLMQNSEFKARFSDRIDAHLAGPVSVPALHARIDSLEALHGAEMVLHEARWSQTAGAYTDEMQRAREWLAARAPILAAQAADFFEHFAVPVELSAFDATVLVDGARLTWRTERERDNRGFEVWRSLEGPDDLRLLASWSTNPELVGAPDSDDPREYVFTDTSFALGSTAWYQLRHEDTSGAVTIHDWIERAGPPVLPNLRLNEIMADNDFVIADEAGEFEDWIELYNPGPDAVSLAGLALSDDAGDPAPWPLPDLVLEAGEFLLVWCDEDLDQGPLHADFKLSAGGEDAALFLVSDGIPYLVDYLTFGPQTTDISLGRLPDGSGDWQFLTTPTPGTANRPIGVTPAGLRGLVVEGARPNPAGERAELRFALGESVSGPVRVGVYDLRGRLVRELVRESLPAGEHVAIWDRRDAGGRRAAAGVYLMRVDAGGVSRTVKLGLVR